MSYEDHDLPDSIERYVIEGHREMLAKVCVLGEVDRNQIKSVIEFGGGVGRMTWAILQEFPEANVKMIDLDDQRSSDLINNQRVEFIEGEFVKVLESGKVAEADLVVLYHAGIKHGFTDNKSLDLLAAAVGKGVLFTGGHLGYVEEFYDRFRKIGDVRIDGLMSSFVWRGKQV